MKFYFKNYDQKIPLNIISSTQRADGIICCEVEIDKKVLSVYLKTGKTKNFYSMDGIKWQTANKMNTLPCLNFQDQLFQIFYGFMPNQQNEEVAGALIARMPGKVVKIIKVQGDKVEKGEPILIIEAMKMENEIKANTSGTIEKIHVTLNQSINSGETLVSIS